MQIQVDQMDPRFFKIAHVGGGAGTICPNMYI